MDWIVFTSFKWVNISWVIVQCDAELYSVLTSRCQVSYNLLKFSTCRYCHNITRVANSKGTELRHVFIYIFGRDTFIYILQCVPGTKSTRGASVLQCDQYNCITAC